MHRALAIVEIVEEIVAHVPSHDLPRILLTCKTFYHPVQDSLWQRQQSLDALASLLPDGLVVPERLVELSVFSSASQRLLFPVEQTAILPLPRPLRGIALNGETMAGIPGGEVVGFGPLMASASPGPRLPRPDQHTKVFHTYILSLF
jgi:hypothetical protein